MKRRLAIVWFMLATCLAPLGLHAHGGLGHIQVTAWGVENLPQGDVRAFLAHPEVFNSILFGAAFPDVGYYPGLKYPEVARTFGEYSHWAQFTQTFVEWIRVNDPPPWTNLESRQRVAFLMGCAAHGFQDEVFDSLYLDQVSQHDGAGQDDADPGTDGFLWKDDLIGLIPNGYVPLQALLDIFNLPGVFDFEITEDHILSSVDTATQLYIDEGAAPVIAEVAYNSYVDALPWTRDNYMNEDIPGSLRAEILPTMHYIEGLWRQLHGDYSGANVVMAAYPGPGRRLRSHEAGVADSWVSLLFSTGIDQTSLAPAWKDAAGLDVPFSQHGTAWRDPWPRIMRLRPTQNLTPGGYYTVQVDSSAPGVGENLWHVTHTLDFQVACDENNPEDCPELTNVAVARLDGAEDFRREWTEDNTVPAPEPPQEESGCRAADANLGALLIGMAGLSLLLRRRRGRP